MGEKKADCKHIMENIAMLRNVMHTLENWNVLKTMPGIITPIPHKAATRPTPKRPIGKENIPPEKRSRVQARNFNFSMSETFVIR